MRPKRYPYSRKKVYLKIDGKITDMDSLPKYLVRTTKDGVEAVTREEFFRDYSKT